MGTKDAADEIVFLDWRLSRGLEAKAVGADEMLARLSSPC
jgi:hypothetical protein